MPPSERAFEVPVCCHLRSSSSLFNTCRHSPSRFPRTFRPISRKERASVGAFFASTSDEIHVLDDDTLPGTEAVELVARRLF